MHPLQLILHELLHRMRAAFFGSGRAWTRHAGAARPSWIFFGHELAESCKYTPRGGVQRVDPGL